MTSRLVRRIALVAFPALLTLACSDGADGTTPRPDAQQALAVLDACPAGDLPWMDAFKAVRGEEGLDALPARAEALAERCPDTWQPIWLEARALLELEQPEAASGRFAEAAKLAVRDGEPEGEARCADSLAWIAYQGGLFDEARKHYDTAIAAAVRAGRDDLQGFSRSNLAALLKDDADFAGARHQLEQAEVALERAGRSDAAIDLAFNRATLLLELGDAVAARETLERVHGEAAADPWTVDASALVLGNLHRALRQLDQARIWHARVSDDFADLHHLALLGMGRTALDEGATDEALTLLRAAAEEAANQDRLSAGAADVYLTEAELRAGNTAAADERLARWIDPGAEDVPGVDAADARWMLGRVRLHQDRPDDALKLLSEAVELLESQGAALDPMSEGLRFLRQRRDPYVDLAVALALADDLPGGVDDRESRILQVISRAKSRGLQRALRQEDGPAFADLDGIQRGLRRGEAILDYLFGDERGILLVITPERRQALPIAGRRQLGSAIARLRGSLTGAGPAADDSAALLHEALLGPARPLLGAARRLYIVPDDELSLIPFEALPGFDGGFLGEQFEIGVLPLAGVPERRAADRTPLLLAGQPVFGDGAVFGELPWAAYELSRLRERWGPEETTLLTGDALTLDRLSALDLGTFRTLHLATHAVASTIDPRRCGVVLSGDERLGLDSILELKLDRSLVVLSACRTGAGELIPGEGVVGLGWAFLQAGASAVVTSHWSVDDEISARLMVAFHEHLAAGADPVAALAAARRELAAREPNPSLWAPFVIVLRPETGTDLFNSPRSADD